MNLVRKSVLGQFSIMFLPIALIVIGIISTFYYGEVQEELDQLKFEGLRLTELHEVTIKHEFQTMISDLMTLSEHAQLRAFLDHPSDESRKALSADFLDFYGYRAIYDQVRFLDDKGMEVVRVDFHSGKPAIVPDKELQPKGDQYYFMDSIRLNRGKVYISPFDLNVENGKVERPFKPMIRIAMPLFDSAGNKKGILILNYLGQNLLDQIGRIAKPMNPGASILLTNQHGYWLKGLQAADEWGFMFKDAVRTFGRVFPEAWAKILIETSGQFSNADGLFSFRTIYPLAADPASFIGSVDVFGTGVGQIGRDGYLWKLVVYVPEGQLAANAREHFNTVLTFLLALFALFAAGTFSLAWVNVKKVKAEDNVEHLAHYDMLTELPNRRLLYDRLKQLMAQEERYKRIFAILFIDLDGFNFVNDKFGRDAGDEVLKEAASRICNDIRKVDTASRIGGDEFLVALTEINDSEGPVIVAEKLIASLGKPFVIDSTRKVVIGASIGISIYPADGLDMDTLIKHADDAMYQAKIAGKNGYRFFSVKAAQ